MAALTQAQLDEALASLPDWEHRDDAIVREYTFADFREAVAFITRMAFEAEQRNHHPELSNVWNRVTLRFTTHDDGNVVTDKDVEMARACDRVAVRD